MKSSSGSLFKVLILLMAVLLGSVTQAKPLETVENLAKAHLVEMNAYNKYIKYAEQADKDGLRDAKISFKFASDSELQHKQLFEKGFSFLGPKDVDYYVDVKSGETVEVHTDDKPPQSKLIDGTYVKAAN